MAKNWALSIGINKYEFLQPLNYAKRDAELMRDFLTKEAGFEKVWLMSDNSPNISGKSTRPTRENLLLTLHKIAEKPSMGNEDNFWFFFSGHGRRHAGKDYLMLTNSVGSLVEQTGIAISYITKLLCLCGAGNVVLIFDACRDEGDKAGGLGIGSENQKGVIAIYSCSPNEKSWEIDEPISKGAFTHVLLEGLRLQGENNCTTVERLDNYLRERVPQFNSEYKKPTQTPCINAEPETKRHLILLPRKATSDADIENLKKDACKAEDEENFELAEKLWVRINTACLGRDLEVVKAFQRIERKRLQMELRYPQPPLKMGSKSEVDSVEIAPKSETEAKNISLQLVSAVGVDYSNLQQLLAAAEWRKADEETAKLMCKVAKREKEGWLTEEDIKKFPCEDLRTIDQLWVQYSKGRFGFSVQKRIWESVGGKRGEINYEIYNKFGKKVGWYVKEKDNWKYWKDLTFSLNAPDGHLPGGGMWWGWGGIGWVCGGVGGVLWGCWCISSLASRLANCNL